MNYSKTRRPSVSATQTGHDVQRELLGTHLEAGGVPTAARHCRAERKTSKRAA